MKINEIAKQLANKINQEHYVLQYLEKIQRTAYDKGVEDAEKHTNKRVIEELEDIITVSPLHAIRHTVKRLNELKQD